MTDLEKLDLILRRLASVEARLTLLENKIGNTNIPNYNMYYTYDIPNYKMYYNYSRPLCSCPPGTACGNVACPYANRAISSLSYNIAS